MKTMKSAASKFAEVAAEKPTEKELETQGQTVLPETETADKEKKEVIAKKPRNTRPHKVQAEPVPAAPSVDPAKTAGTTTEEAGTEPASKVMGQPKKYDEKCKHVSFSLPVSVIENLKIISHLKRTNQTQIILEMINKEIDDNSEKIKMYKELMK